MALIVSERDIEPLLKDPTAMDAAIDAVEKATVADYQGRVRSQDMVDRTKTEPSNFLQIHLATDDSFVTGFQVFGQTPGLPRPNTRFVVLLDGETRQLQAIVPYEGVSPLRVGASARRGLSLPGAQGRKKRRNSRFEQAGAPSAAGDREDGAVGRPRARLQPDAGASRGVRTRDIGMARRKGRGRRERGGRGERCGHRRFGDEYAHARTRVAMGETGSAGHADRRRPAAGRGFERGARGAADLGLNRGREHRPRALRFSNSRRDLREVSGRGARRRHPRRGDATGEDMTVVFDVGRINIWAVTVTHWAYEWARERELGTQFSLSAV
jgi:hypothetical protein